MSKEWETEEDDEAQKAPPKLVFAVKAYLVLVDSDKENWGIVEDTMNNILWQPGSGENVGTWSRTKYDNLIHVSLSTALSALEDRSVQTFAHYAEERRQRKEEGKPSKRVKKTVETAEQVPIQGLSIDVELKFNSLRARLGRAK